MIKFLLMVCILTLVASQVLAGEFKANSCSPFLKGDPNPYQFANVCEGTLNGQMALSIKTRKGQTLVWSAKASKSPTPALGSGDLARGSKFYAVKADLIGSSGAKGYA